MLDFQQAFTPLQFEVFFHCVVMGGFLTSEWFVWGEGLADTRDGFDEHFQSPHGEHLTLVEDDVENLTFEADKLYEFVLDWSQNFGATIYT